MGVKLKDLTQKKEITFDHLKEKILAVDAHNMLYQFLTTIRQRDGKPLTNSNGQVTSHLNGLFYRCTKFMEKGLKLVFVFDGTPPALKATEIARRKEIKRQAELKHKEALLKGDVEAMRKYASRTVRLTSDMINESKQLLSLLGIPVIQAPSEGEAQAAHLTKKGDAYAVVSQDFDSLVSGAVRVVRNLSIEGKRKKTGKYGFGIVKPEMITLGDMLNHLGIDSEQLIVMSILIGTDYNPKGVPNIGPKKALKLVKEIKDFDQIFSKVEWDKHSKVEWKEIFYTIKDMNVTNDYDLSWNKPDIDKIRELLIETHNFSRERTEIKLKKFVMEREAQKQTGLAQWGA